MATSLNNQHPVQIQAIELEIRVRDHDSALVEPQKIFNGSGLRLGENNHKASQVEVGPVQERGIEDKGASTHSHECKLEQQLL